MKVDLPTPLRVEKLHDGWWKVLEDFLFLVDGQAMVVPAGFLTDFASVPRLPFVYLVAGNVCHTSALLHDFLYEEQMGQKFADDVFLAAMEAEGVSWWRRRLMHAAVRAFGGSRYEGKVVDGQA